MRGTMTRGRAPLLVVLLALSLVSATACGVEGGALAPAPSGGPEATATTIPAGGLDATDVRDALRRSVALVSTPTATGSAIVLADGYLATNAHVVDPFDAVDLIFDGGDRVEDVPVVGVDLTADLAVVGPLDAERQADLDLAPVEVEAPDDELSGRAFLIGFPGDQDEDDPELRVSQGSITGREDDDGWDLWYLRSSTPIEEGQSGGALVDERGRVVAMSGLADDEGVALSLEGGRVAEAIEAVLDGDGSDWDPVELGEATTEAEVFVRDVWDAHAFYVVPDEAGDDPTSVSVEGAEPQIAVAYPGESDAPWAVTSSIEEDDVEDYWYTYGDEEVIEPDGAGRWVLDLEPGEPSVITIGSAAGRGPLDVRFDAPVVPISAEPVWRALTVDRPVELTLSSTRDSTYSEVGLQAGTTYEISARTPSGDVSWYLEAEDDGEDSADADDGGGGLFDYDAVDEYTAEHTGTHRLWVYDEEGISTTVRILVRKV